MKLSALLQDLIPEGTPLPQREITGLSLSSKQILPGHAFIATEKALPYIPDALERGAHAILYEESGLPMTGHPPALEGQNGTPIIGVPQLSQQLNTLADRFYGPFPALSTTGVTGTNGKTTVSYLLAQCLTLLGTPCGFVGTLGAGLIDHITMNGFTTPDILKLHACYAALQAQGAQSVAMEVTSIGLVQGRVARVPFESALFTNLTQDHLDYHGDMTAYGNAKLQFFEVESLQRAILNAEDPFVGAILRTLPASLPVVLCAEQTKSIDPYAGHSSQISTVIAQDAVFHAHGITATIMTPFGRGTLRSPLIGAFNLSNLLLVVGELLMRNYSLDDVLYVMANAVAPPGRMECLTGLQGDNIPQVIVDYAHTPDALARAIQAARSHCKGRLWCVFGCGGDRDPLKRGLMGAIAHQYADQIILTNDNPRTEDPQRILDAILAGIDSADRARVYIEPDREKAIAFALSEANADDTVLIAGKGHEDYQIIGDTRYPFSDIACVKTIIGKRFL